MARTLRRSVVVGGKLVVAGTAETPELAKAVTNPFAWDGPAKAEPDEKSGGEGVKVPAESETRGALEEFAVAHAGMSKEQAEGYANKGELYEAITAALQQA